ncbi:MAG TPA: hypothetical protein VGN24_07325 [Rhodanobacter sp.]|nr:hypothetical protein [Rhodanobacter sp.]
MIKVSVDSLMGISLLRALTVVGAPDCLLPGYPITRDGFHQGKHRASMTFVEHLLDRPSGRIPTFARAMTDPHACFLRTMADPHAGILRAVTYFPGHMPRGVPHVTGTVGNTVAGSLRVVLDVLAGAVLFCMRGNREPRKNRAGNQEAADFLVVHGVFSQR